MTGILEKIFQELSEEEQKIAKIIDLSKSTDEIITNLEKERYLSFSLEDENDSKNQKNK